MQNLIKKNALFFNGLNRRSIQRARCFAPICILGAALFVGGADFPQQTAFFSCIVFGIAGILSTADQKYGVPRLYFAMIGASILVLLSGKAGPWYLARTEVIALWAGAAMWLSGHYIGQSRENTYRTWSYLSWIGTVMAIFAFIIHLTTSQGAVDTSRSFQVGRLAANFGSSNTAATLFGMLLVLSAGRLISNAHRKLEVGTPKMHRINRLLREELASTISAILCFGCLLLTESRAGIIISLFTLLVVFGLELSRYRSRKRALLAQDGEKDKRAGFVWMVSIAVIVAAALGFQFVEGRSATIIADSGGRLALLAEYWPKVLEKPWFGHGLGSFNRLNDAMITADNAALIAPLGAAHNVLLQWLLQLGVVGTGLMLAIFVFILKDIGATLFYRGSRDRAFFVTVLGVTAIAVLHGMIDYALEIPAIMWFLAFVLGLGSGRATAHSKSEHAAPA